MQISLWKMKEFGSQSIRHVPVCGFGERAAHQSAQQPEPARISHACSLPTRPDAGPVLRLSLLPVPEPQLVRVRPERHLGRRFVARLGHLPGQRQGH